MWPFSGGHILENGPSEIGQECVPNPLTWKNPASIYRIQPLRGRPGRSLCVAPLKEEPYLVAPSPCPRPFSGGHFLDVRPPPKAGVPRFCPGDSSTNPELVREEPPKARNLVTVSRVVPIQKDK